MEKKLVQSNELIKKYFNIDSYNISPQEKNNNEPAYKRVSDLGNLEKINPNKLIYNVKATILDKILETIFRLNTRLCLLPNLRFL